MKKKIVTVIVAMIMLILFSTNVSNAALSGISGARSIAVMGESAVGQMINLSVNDLANSANDVLYCISYHNRNSSGSTTYKVLSYIEIQDGKAKVYDVNGTVAESGESEVNKVLAEILSGTYGTLGYGGSIGDYSPTQRALYMYWNTWLSSVGASIGTYGGWYMNNDYADNGEGAAIIAKAQAAVAAGSNTSVKIYLLDDWEGKQAWQRLMIAEPGDGLADAVIKKVDSETGAALANVGFTIKKNETGEYVKTTSKGVEYTTQETVLKTNGAGKIELKGIQSGFYTVEEKFNPNSGYESSKMITMTIYIENGSKKEIKISNYKKPEDSNISTGGNGHVTVYFSTKLVGNEGKDNNLTGTQSTSDKVKVYWKTKGGQIIDSTEVTIGQGGSFTAEYDPTGNPEESHMYAPIRADQNSYNTFNDSYIEFEYNGFKYSTTGDSKAIENKDTRTFLDNNISTTADGYIFKNDYFKISGNQAVSKDGKDPGYCAIRASTEGQITNIIEAADKASIGGQASYCHKHCRGDGNVVEVLGLETKTYKEKEHYDHTDTEYDEETGKIIFSRGVYCDETGEHCMEERPNIDTYEKRGFDLVLFVREQPDVELMSDITEVRVIMKDQQYTYKYGNRGLDTAITDYTVGFFVNNSNIGSTQTYVRYVNPADVSYVNYHNTNDLEVYVKYKIAVANASNTLTVKINEVKNYYDSSQYEFYEGAGWTNSGGVLSYKPSTGQELKLEHNKSSILPEIEFKVKDSSIKSLLNKDLTIANTSEINSMTTLYGAETLSAEGKKGVLTNSTYAGVDYDSTAGNCRSVGGGRGEDDSSDAPAFVLKKDPKYKLISGTVYEDGTITTDGQRLGNGRKDSSDKGLANARVELLRVKDDGTTEDGYLYYVGNGAERERAVTYTNSEGNFTLGESSTKGVVVDNYIIKYTYGNNTIVKDSDGNTLLANGPTTLDDGKTEINARNYKSTIITTDPVKSVMNGSDNSIKWHLTQPDNASIAVDDLKERLDIENLQYSNFATGVNMSAYTPKFRVQVQYENADSQTADVDTEGKLNGRDFIHNWTMFDFGIIERPRENLVIDKKVSNLKITLANGQVLTEGNPYGGEKLNYVKALGNSITSREDAAKASAKLLYIEMDSELIQGSRLDITYAISITNNNEIDYDYETDYTDIDQSKSFITTNSRANYYYYGNSNGIPEMKADIEKVVDYMDPELTCQVGSGTENPDWARTIAEDLRSQGLISEASYDMINKDVGNYLIFTTEQFKNIARGETQTHELKASKLLGNQATDYIYENHVEISVINHKIARTIDSTVSGTQITKQYMPGNYIPSLTRINATKTNGEEGPLTKTVSNNTISGTLENTGLHNQDDDMITIRITPPTGTSEYTVLYITAGLIGLIVIVGGIYFIKKRVLGK